MDNTLFVIERQFNEVNVRFICPLSHLAAEGFLLKFPIVTFLLPNLMTVCVSDYFLCRVLLLCLMSKVVNNLLPLLLMILVLLMIMAIVRIRNLF